MRGAEIDRAVFEIDDDPVDPERAMICTVWIEGMVAMAPKVGRFSRHSLRRRLRGVRVAEVNCKTRWMVGRMAANSSTCRAE